MEVDDETLTYAEEDWDCPEQTGIDKGVQLDSPFAMETRQRKKGNNKKEVQPVWRRFCHRQDSFERHDGLAIGPGRSSDATRD